MKRVLVTGATGYVGGRLVRALLEQNYQVRVLVRDPKKVKQYTWANSVEVVVGNATDYTSTFEALKNIDIAYYFPIPSIAQLSLMRLNVKWPRLLAKRLRMQM